MTRTIHKTPEPVVLEGFQCVLKPSVKFNNYTLSAVINEDMIEALESDREQALKWAETKLANPKRSTLRPEPWEEVSEGKYKVKFSWKEDAKPPVVDTEGSPILDKETPIYSGSMVKLAFYQKPYVLVDKVTYGTSLKLAGVQLVTAGGTAGVDTGDLSEEAVANLFGKTKGFKVGEPAVTPSEEDEDF